MNNQINYASLDAKLKNLVQLCKETHNEKKFSVVFFVLIKNLVNEKGIRLGFKPAKDQKVCEHMAKINKFLLDKINVRIFEEEMVKKITIFENVFLKNKGRIPFKYAPDLVKIYYDLRRLKVPNIYDAINGASLKDGSSTALNLQKILFSNNTQKSWFPFKKDNNNVLLELVKNDLNRKEAILQKSLQHRYDEKDLENLIKLRISKDSIKNQESRKIFFKGSIKNDWFYRKSFNEIPGFLLVAIATVFFFFGIIIAAQSVIHPELNDVFLSMMFIFFILGIGLGLLYWSMYKKEADH